MGAIVKDNLWVLEYSPTQKAFHIQRLVDAVDSNQRRFWHRPQQMFDWTVIYTGTQRQCELMLVQSERRIAKEFEVRVWTH